MAEEAFAITSAAPIVVSDTGAPNDPRYESFP